MNQLFRTFRLYRKIKNYCPDFPIHKLIYCFIHQIICDFIIYPVKRFLCNKGIHLHTKKVISNEYLNLNVIEKMSSTTYHYSAEFCGYCCKLLKVENPAEFLESLDTNTKIRSI